MPPTINGSGKRQLESWIDRFILSTEGVETPKLFRKWAAITTIAAVLEQKVWITTSSPMYPNLYTGMIADPGIGKTRIISKVAELIKSLPDPFIAPTSVNSASLIDHLAACKRVIINMPNQALEYNSSVILADELGSFMSEYDNDLIPELTSFYNVTAIAYGQQRRGKLPSGEHKLSIERPQLNILFGSTPSNLMKFMPDFAWDQGFTSRIILVYSDEQRLMDDFSGIVPELPRELFHDLRIINNLVGRFTVTEDYRIATLNWRNLGYPPVPTHPRLQHYCTRRKEHLYRLSMVAAVNRGNALILAKEDFNQALSWLIEAEAAMPKIFKDTSTSADAGAIDEILHFVQTTGAVNEGKLINFARKRIRSQDVIKTLEIMERSKLITVSKTDRFGVRTFIAPADLFQEPSSEA